MCQDCRNERAAKLDAFVDFLTVEMNQAREHHAECVARREALRGTSNANPEFLPALIGVNRADAWLQACQRMGTFLTDWKPRKD